MPWNEFFQLFKDSMISFVGGGDFSINKSIRTGDFSNELEQFSLQYPTLKSKLIDSRDIYMSKNIVKLFRDHNCENSCCDWRRSRRWNVKTFTQT